MINFLYRLLGRVNNDDKIVAQKKEEAHAITSEIHTEIDRIIESINVVSYDNYMKTKDLTNQLGIVTRKIAEATGAERRGL